ncbi:MULTISPECIES: hypothetical protein [Leptospira]|uniref:Uncharacterized protein n=3 Tax=Leptospira weilii TaxID=28184 RepID=A0A828YWU5_9LEPT|nr:MULTISPECIES: hypothetical protein [Leptospira]EMM73885.1 hypothetical protein LEP1GSC038_2195 [Leptospira weilii str. 2006001855]EKR62349.1 hypothetical protein LEP1GSC036_1512 [Leptospira weilii str. 2006001853]EMJ62640.1 hypothetical protein LEP1GSC051_0770 [Leptospira sp. P2653]EMN42652.1 hypothetical protein LEP1GSC086_1549 [Leptospira weilii str. LNT 1234]EMN89049.1 hypothetical protein LEP1GSC108_3706 [Leptospira weilii str. UI 13098]
MVVKRRIRITAASILFEFFPKIIEPVPVKDGVATNVSHMMREIPHTERIGKLFLPTTVRNY